MPVYEYYCPSCRDTFELLRPMKLSSELVSCPSGHDGAARTVSVFASVRGDAGMEFDSLPSSGGCACGGACACGSH